ncbi:MAG: PAS domain S-box protein, partial [Desulfobacteraceae bacterium]
ACKEMGYTLDEVLSMRVSDIDPTFRIESWAEHYQEVKKRGSTRLETQQVAGDGKIHDVEVFTNVVKFGDLEFMCSFGRDITELRLSERTLREQVEFERLIADIAAKLAQTGPERLGETLDSTLRSLGQFLCTDRSFLAQFSGDGKCLKHTNIWAAEGINILPSLFELDIATDLPWLGQQIRMGKVVNAGPGLTALPDEAKELGHWLEHNGITSGVVVPVLVEDRSIGFLGLDTVDQPREYPTALVDRLKIVADMIGSTLRRVQAQKELRESEAKYRSLTNNLNVGVYRNTTGPKGKFIEFNPAFLKIFGYESRDELLSMTVSDIYKDSKKREAFNEKMLKEGYVKDEENVYMRKDGTTFTGAVSAVAVRDHDGRVSYYDGIVEDITKRKEVEKALQESQEDLQRLAGKLISTQEAERRLLAREMHDDISQRLAILAIDAGKLERLCEDSANPIVETLQDMKNRLVDLSSDIHAISRQLHPSILDDLGLFDAVKAECQGFRRREGITVKYEPKAIPYQLPKDAALTLFRIVQEGLRNVAKHAQTQDANVSLFGMDDSIYLSISDDGVGFDYSEARKKPGLGLASMEERVRLIQGEISIKSEPGKGTVIEVRAPLTGS